MDYFSEEFRQKYYDRAWLLLARHGIENIEIDETQFSVVKNEKVKVYVSRFDKYHVKRDELGKLKAIPEYHSIYDRYMRVKKGEETPLFEKGYFLFEIKEA